MIQKKKVVLCVLLFQLIFNANSQQAVYTFTFHKTPIKEAIKEISLQSKINFLYNPSILPDKALISSSFSKSSLTDVLEKVLKGTNIKYKIHKNTIILYQNNEEIRETHQLSRPQVAKETDKQRYIITDTVIYSIVSHDTVVTKLTDYVKVYVNDTVKVYDTIKVAKPINRFEYQNKTHSFVVELAYSSAILYSTLHSNSIEPEFRHFENASMTSRLSNWISLTVLYKYKKMEFETGIGYLTTIYNFNINYLPSENQLEKKYVSDLHFQYITVPIIIGYSYTQNRFIYDLKCGFITNFYIRSDSYYVKSMDSKLEVLDSKAPEAKTMFSPYLAFGADFILNEYFHLYAQPYYTLFTKPYSKSNSENFNNSKQLGVKIAIRYYF